MDHFSCYKDYNSRGSSQEIITRRGGGLASGLHTFRNVLCSENIEKLQKLPHEVHLLRNSIDSVHGDINTVGASCVKVKSDVTSILEEVRDADKIAHDVKTHVLGLHAETNNLKGDIHGL